MESKLRLIYIESLGHSGTTLLDVLLNAHSKIASAGELKKLHEFLPDEKRRCTCGATPINTCEFWSKVLKELEAHGCSPERIRTASKAPEALAENVLLLQTIASVAGVPALVDSSKSLRRLMLLLRSDELDILPVIMVRDPKGQIWSTVRKGRRLLGRIKAYNSTYLKIAWSLRGRPQIWIRYEDLVRDPTSQLKRILDWLGEPLEEDQLDWAAAEKHNINGNRMRFATSSAITADDSWRDNLTLAQRVGIGLGTLPARLLSAKQIGRRPPPSPKGL